MRRVYPHGPTCTCIRTQNLGVAVSQFGDVLRIWKPHLLLQNHGYRGAAGSSLSWQGSKFSALVPPAFTSVRLAGLKRPWSGLLVVIKIVFSCIIHGEYGARFPMPSRWKSAPSIRSYLGPSPSTWVFAAPSVLFFSLYYNAWGSLLKQSHSPRPPLVSPIRLLTTMPTAFVRPGTRTMKTGMKTSHFSVFNSGQNLLRSAYWTSIMRMYFD